MAKITWTDKTNLHPAWDEEYQFTAGNANETKASVNDLYDAVGEGAEDDNVRVVSINTGGATNKIKDTLDAITDSSADKPYLVEVRPGAGNLAYIEDNFTVPQFVSLISIGGITTTQIQANTTTGTQVTLSTDSSIKGFEITGKTAGTCIGITAAGAFGMEDMKFEDCTNGIVVNNASATVITSELVFTENTQGILTDCIRVEAGSVTVERLRLAGLATVGNAIVKVDGANSVVTVLNVASFSPNVNKGVEIINGCRTNLYDISLVACDIGILQSGGAITTTNNIKCFRAVTAGFQCELGTGGLNEVTFSGVVFEADTGGLDANVTTDQLEAVGGPIQLRVEQSYWDPGAEVVAQIYNLFEGDEASKFISEVHVGSPTRPRESVFGEGDSHSFLLAYTTTDDVAFTDITDEVKSASGSTFTFPGTSAGDSIYLCNLYPDSSGNPLDFYGIKTNVVTAAVLGAGNFTIQYYNAVSGWIDATYMETQADRRYYQYAKDIFAHTGSHHIRGPIRLQADTDPNTRWDVNDPPTTGTDRYWLRLRIASTITTAPVFEQFKIHTNRFEVNGDGWIEYHGSARPQGALGFTLGAGRELDGNMGDQNIWIDQNLGTGLIDNQFSTTSQYFGFTNTIPDDLDTGSGVTVTIAARANAAGTVTLQCIYGAITSGDTAYTSDPGLIPIPSRAVTTDSATFTGAGDVQFFTFLMDFSNFRARKDPADGITDPDIAFATINPTTIPTNIQLINVESTFYKWCEGGHI